MRCIRKNLHTKVLFLYSFSLLLIRKIIKNSHDYVWQTHKGIVVVVVAHTKVTVCENSRVNNAQIGNWN